MPTRIRRSACLLLMLIVPLSARGQSLTESQKDKLDPRLQTVLARTLPQLGLSVRAPEAVPVESSPLQPGKQAEEKRYAVFVETVRPNRLRSAGIDINTAFPSFVSARVTPAQLTRLARMDAVEYVDVPSRAYPTNDVAAGETGVKLLHRGKLNSTVYKGQGTLTCIVDTGIDWSHLDFRDPVDSTRSRILSVWDQTLVSQGSEQTPADRGDNSFSGLDYGVEYTRRDIEDEFDGSPAGFVRSQDIDGHGTHVAGTAAGNGASLPSRTHAGMAPNSDIVVVKSGHTSFQASNVVDGISYCGKIADLQSKPVVVNLSLGSDDGPHDGTSPSARAVDSFVQPGKLAVAAAGNSGNDVIHQNRSLAAGNGIDITFDIPSYSPQSGSANDDVKLDIWFDGAPDVAVSVIYDNTVVASQPQPSDGASTSSSEAGAAYINSRIDSENSDRNVQVHIYDDSESETPREGTWKVRLLNSSDTSTDLHAWLYDHTIGNETPVELTDGDTRYTVNSPGTAAQAITVGSYVHRWRWFDSSESPKVYSTAENRSDDLSAFSSIGPRRDGLQKPDITAPGQGLVSTLSSDASTSSGRIVSDGKHYVTQGTSMAAPVVAGTAALLLQDNEELSQAEITTALNGSARTDSFTGPVPNDRWGYGKMDAFQAFATAANASVTREILSYDEWGSEVYLEIRSDANFALRFTPTTAGQLSGAFIHAYRTVNLTDSLTVEVWSDDSGGKPQRHIGSTARVGPDQFQEYSWNYVDLSRTDVLLSPDSSYHLVFSPAAASDTLTVLADEETVDGRTSHTFGAAWQSSDEDMRVRPEIASVTSNPGEATARERESPLPSTFSLNANYPNPFNPTTTIPYTVPEESHVTLGIFNVLGQEIYQLVDAPRMPGRHSATFDASELPSGIYFYRLEANSFVKTRTMTLIK